MTKKIAKGKITRETVSIRIDPKLWKELRKAAIDENTSVAELMEKILTGKISIRISIKSGTKSKK